MLWNVFISILPLAVLIWIWTDSKIQEFVSTPFMVTASFVLAATMLIALANSIWGNENDA